MYIFRRMKTTDELREHLKSKRAEKGWTYKQLADRCGLPVTTVFNFLRGADPRGGSLDKFRKA